MNEIVEIKIEDEKEDFLEFLYDEINKNNAKKIIIRVSNVNGKAAALEKLRNVLTSNISKTVIVYVEE